MVALLTPRRTPALHDMESTSRALGWCLTIPSSDSHGFLSLFERHCTHGGTQPIQLFKISSETQSDTRYPLVHFAATRLRAHLVCAGSGPGPASACREPRRSRRHFLLTSRFVAAISAGYVAPVWPSLGWTAWGLASCVPRPATSLGILHRGPSLRVRELLVFSGADLFKPCLCSPLFAMSSQEATGLCIGPPSSDATSATVRAQQDAFPLDESFAVWARKLRRGRAVPRLRQPLWYVNPGRNGSTPRAPIFTRYQLSHIYSYRWEADG